MKTGVVITVGDLLEALKVLPPDMEVALFVEMPGGMIVEGIRGDIHDIEGEILGGSKRREKREVLIIKPKGAVR